MYNMLRLDPRILDSDEFKELPPLEQSLVFSVVNLQANVAFMEATQRVKREQDEHDDAWLSGVWAGIGIGALAVFLFMIVLNGRRAEVEA